MEISERKKAANRANAAKSTGPRTPDGKRNSALNAKAHKRLANSVLVDNESRPRFASLLNSFFADYDPRDVTERCLVEMMAVAHWRLNRAWTIETVGLNYETRRQKAPDLGNDPPTRAMLALQSMCETNRHPDLIGRYERRYAREFYRALEALRKHRDRNTTKKSAARSHQPDESERPVLQNEPTETQNEPTAQPNEPTPQPSEPTGSEPLSA